MLPGQPHSDPAGRGRGGLSCLRSDFRVPVTVLGGVMGLFGEEDVLARAVLVQADVHLKLFIPGVPSRRP